MKMTAIPARILSDKEKNYHRAHRGHREKNYGNLSVFSVGSVVVFFLKVYDQSRSNTLIKDKTGKYTYDLNGNRLADGLNSYQYNALDRLIGVNTPTESYRYTYDPLGRRLAKSNLENTTYFLWQKDQEIGSITKEGQIKELRVLGLSNQAVAYELEEKLYVPLHDNIGNVRALLDESGNCLSSHRYSAFGKEESQGDIQSPWRFSGKRIDPETGFSYFGKRYYNPRTLNWLTPDPLGETDGPNYYAFVHNNPLHYIDPDGTFAFVAAPIVFELFAISWGAAAQVAFTWLTVETAVATAIGAAAGVAVYNAGGEVTHSPEQGKGDDAPPYSGAELGNDPSKCPPYDGFEWKGNDPPGGRRGAWYNRKKKHSLHPDLDHPPPKKPHWDYQGPKGALTVSLELI